MRWSHLLPVRGTQAPSLLRVSTPNLLVPQAVMHPRPVARDFAPDNRGESAPYHGRAHVNVDDKGSDGDECRHDVDQHRRVAQPTPTPRDVVHKPHRHPREQQGHASEKHYPKKLLLPDVEAADGRQILVLVTDVITQVFGPFTVRLSGLHVPSPRG